jgi:Flp pilus assembly protein TadD
MSLINKVLHDLEDRHAFLSMQPQSVLSDLRSAQDYARNRSASERALLALGIVLILAATLALLGRNLLLDPIPSVGPAPAPVVKAAAATDPAGPAPAAVAAIAAPAPELKLKLDSLSLPALAVASAPPAAAGAPKLLNFEVSGDGVETVIDLVFSSPPRYSLHVLEQPPRLLVEAQRVELSPPSRRDLMPVAMVDGLRFGGDGDTSKLIFDLNRSVAIADARITPGPGDVYRLEIRLSAAESLLITEQDVARQLSLPPAEAMSAPTDAAVQPAMEVVRRPPPTPGLAEQAFQQGADAYRIGDFSAAIDHFQRAVRAQPDHSKARQFLVAVLVDRGDLQSAARFAEEGLGYNSRDPVLLRTLARIQFEKGDGEAALAVLARNRPALQDDPDHYALMAAILQKQSKHTEAAELYGQLLRLDPQRGVWWAGLGISLEAMGRAGEARGAFERALGDGSAPPDLRRYSAERAAALGRQPG